MPQPLDTQLHDAIERLNNKQKKELLGIVKNIEKERKTPPAASLVVAGLDDYSLGKIKDVRIDGRSNEAARKLKTKKVLPDAGNGTETIGSHWEDKDFVAEMDRRYQEYKSGITTLVSLDEVERKALLIVEKRKVKKAS